MSSEERTTNVVQRYAQPVQLKLTKGAKGTYRWEIQVHAESPLQALRQIDEINRELRYRYSQPQPDPSKPAADKPSSPTDPHQRMSRAQKSAVEAGKKLTQGGEWPWGK